MQVTEIFWVVYVHAVPIETAAEFELFPFTTIKFLGYNTTYIGNLCRTVHYHYFAIFS